MSSPIKKVVVSEKSTRLESEGKYVFMVAPGASKNEIKKAVKDLYGVDVVRVASMTRKPKMKSYRRVQSARGGYKKAVVTLKEGQAIKARSPKQ